MLALDRTSLYPPGSDPLEADDGGTGTLVSLWPWVLWLLWVLDVSPRVAGRAVRYFLDLTDPTPPPPPPPVLLILLLPLLTPPAPEPTCCRAVPALPRGLLGGLGLFGGLFVFGLLEVRGRMALFRFTAPALIGLLGLLEVFERVDWVEIESLLLLFRLFE